MDRSPVGGEQTFVPVYLYFLTPHNAGLAHAPGHHRGVTGDPTPAGEDASRHGYAVNVVGFGLWPDQDDRYALMGGFNGLSGIEIHLATGCAR